MSVLLQDLRYAIRMLLKSPGFTIAVLTTLVLVIGVNTAMFSLVNTALFAPLQFDDADRLVRVFRQSPDGGEAEPFSYLDYLEYRDRNDAFEELAAYGLISASVDTSDGSGPHVGQVVSGNYFEVFGVRAVHGRVLTQEDDRTPGAHPVVVLSYGYWQRAFGGDPGAVGRAITLGGHPYTVLGVAPQGFAGAMPVPSPDLWVPVTMLEQIRPQSRGRLQQRGSGFLLVVGKLMPGLGREQAQASLDVTAARLVDVDPDRYTKERALVVPSNGIIPMTPGMRRVALAVSGLIMLLVWLVLLVGCANVVNLLLARSVARRKEIGIRLALGASRWRIVRQLLTESLLLAGVGGAAGLLASLWVMNLLITSLPRLPFNLLLELDFGVDRRVLLYTAAVSLFSAALFSLLPALGATRIDVASSLSDDGGHGRLGLQRSRIRNALVVAQVASSVVLLIVAGLFGRSLMQARAIDSGFDHENVLAVMFDLGTHESDRGERVALMGRLLQRSRALPGVEAASIQDCLPLTMTRMIHAVWIESRPYADPDDARTSVASSTISAENFRTLGIPLLQGRDFTERDTVDAPLVAIVNRAFVERYWPGQDPVGRRISTAGPEGPFIEVVGVVGTIKYWLIGEEPRPYIYLPLGQGRDVSMAALQLRTTGDPRAQAAAVRTLMRRLDSTVTVLSTSSLSDLIGFILLPARLAALGSGLFGILALLLASVGLYGIMSYTVSQRTHEIGVRVALGAQRADITHLILRQGIALTVAGLVLGLAISVAGTRLLAGLLYGVGTSDPVTFAGVSALLAAVALLACYIPARRTTKLDPLVALRCE